MTKSEIKERIDVLNLKISEMTTKMESLKEFKDLSKSRKDRAMRIYTYHYTYELKFLNNLLTI